MHPLSIKQYWYNNCETSLLIRNKKTRAETVVCKFLSKTYTLQNCKIQFFGEQNQNLIG